MLEFKSIWQHSCTHRSLERLHSYWRQSWCYQKAIMGQRLNTIQPESILFRSRYYRDSDYWQTKWRWLDPQYLEKILAGFLNYPAILYFLLPWPGLMLTKILLSWLDLHTVYLMSRQIKMDLILLAAFFMLLLSCSRRAWYIQVRGVLFASWSWRCLTGMWNLL